MFKGNWDRKIAFESLRNFRKLIRKSTDTPGNSLDNMEGAVSCTNPLTYIFFRLLPTSLFRAEFEPAGFYQV